MTSRANESGHHRPIADGGAFLTPPSRTVDFGELRRHAVTAGIPERAFGRSSIQLLDALFRPNPLAPEFQYDAAAIASEINFLKGLAQARRSQRGNLKGCLAGKGIWHKHFVLGTRPHSCITLLMNGRMPFIGKEITSLPGAQTDAQLFRASVSQYVADRIKPHFERALSRRLTGGWIIFVKANGVNYYFALTPHGLSDDDVMIFVHGGIQQLRTLAEAAALPPPAIAALQALATK